MSLKILGIGFQKTGTSTLREALQILDYKVKDTSARALVPILKKDYQKILTILEGYDAAEDTPWYMIYKELDERIAGMKFILTIRDEESWYRSVARHIGDLRSAQHEWIYGRGKGLPKEYKENTIAVYCSHNEEVVQYFKDRPDDLLILDLTQGDGWDKLCAFLDCPIPDVPFPHYNKGTINKMYDNTWSSRFKFFRQQLKSRIKIWYLDRVGWYKRD